MAHLKFICVILYFSIFLSLFTRGEAFSSANRVGKRTFKVNICYIMFCTQGNSTVFIKCLSINQELKGSSEVIDWLMATSEKCSKTLKSFAWCLNYIDFLVRLKRKSIMENRSHLFDIYIEYFNRHDICFLKWYVYHFFIKLR